jgi:hypothetical protein
MKRWLLSPLVLVALSGCGKPAPSDAAGPAPQASSSSVAPAPSAVPKGTLALGERITSPLVPLSDVAAHPSQFESRTIATSGKVTAVCQEMGCWMELADANGHAHVRMHGHDFFVPKTASGHVARVQATIVKGGKGEDDCDEGEKESSGPAKGMAKVELDATGVELD